jgi:hypothetical protein
MLSLRDNINKLFTFFAERAILTIKHVTVNEINSELIRRMPKELIVRSFFNITVIKDDNVKADPKLEKNVLRFVKLNNLFSGYLELKIRAPIILLRNFNFSARLCNESRMIITNIRRNVLKMKLLIGKFAGQARLIPRIKLNFNDTEYPQIIRRKQFPVKFYFAMTINKS